MAARVRLRWARPAVLDLQDIRAFLRDWGPEVAARFASSIRTAANRLQEHPRVGARLEGVPIAGEIRSVVVGNHRLIYRIDTGVVCVLRVWDTRRNPSSLWPHVASVGDEE